MYSGYYLILTRPRWIFYHVTPPGGTSDQDLSMIDSADGVLSANMSSCDDNLRSHENHHVHVPCVEKLRPHFIGNEQKEAVRAPRRGAGPDHEHVSVDFSAFAFEQRMVALVRCRIWFRKLSN